MPADRPDIRLSRHAIERMTQRGIDISLIERTILAPDSTRPDGIDEGLMHYLKALPEFGDRVLRVVVRSVAPSTVIVVTAFIDRAARSR